ncbi:MAG: HAMP domain-containing histidine kinase [Proteobacteria bacterium]|nr:HAMP domain-containing histidine kinase [Pseudomonadota bacterium]
MKSLNRKLSLLLLSLFIIVGILLGMITRYSTVQYNLEITQRLNGSIAMYVADEEPLIINGQYNETALKRLAQQAMVINPTVEVYLLDSKGEVLSHNLPPQSVQLNKVPLAPINQFLEQDSQRPILNSDPRSPENNKTFSVAKIINNGTEEGYVYVILGGKKYEEITSNISKNYILQLTFFAILAVIIMAFLMGSLMLMKLTRPLKTLRDKVIQFQKTSNEGEKNYDGDEIQQLNSAFTDMSERIDNQLEQIKNADQARRDLITNVSHDLRTPLSSMQGYLDTLLIKQQSMSKESTQEYLSIARKHCGRLGTMINDLFELSKLDSNIMKPNLDTFSMAELIQDVSLDFSHLAQQKGLKLNMELLEGNTNVRADIGLMQRVLENLISNAIKHTGKNGEIIIKLENSNKGFNIIIQDTGRGISEHELPNIFNRLYRADNTSKESPSSSGLGLAIVKKILDIHHSTIQVTSQLNQGTQFSFYLPLAR